jgi:hypothetical protein
VKLKTKKRKGTYIKVSLGHIKKVKQLQSYSLQGKKWVKVKYNIKGLVYEPTM